MEFALKLGWWFFLIKGILWLVLFGCVGMGFVSKEQLRKIKSKMSVWQWFRKSR